MKKKVLIICGGLLAVIIVATATFNLYVKPNYVTPLVLAVEEFLLEDEETLDLLIQEYEKSLTEDEKVEYEIEKIKTEEQKSQELISPSELEKEMTENKDDETIEPQPEELKKPKKKKVVAGGKTMEELQAEVAPNDLKAGLKIASKIDTGHLLGLSKGGFTKENKQAASTHLRSRLTANEYSQLKGLVGKYAHLLK